MAAGNRQAEDARRLFAAVGQLPFESASGDGTVVNVFCTLVPVLFEDGTVAGGAERFPNNGLIWWKLRAASRTLALPGRLLSIALEPAPQYVPGEPNKEYYQAVPHDVSGVGPDEALEIVNVVDRSIRRARDLVNVPGVGEMDHPPLERALVRWQGALYGPFQTRVVASHEGTHRVSFSALPGEGTMIRVEDDALNGLAGHIRLSDVRVSLDNFPVYRTGLLAFCTYELLLADAFAALRRAAEEELPVYRDDELITRAAKRLLSRKDRQQLAVLLEQLQDRLSDLPEDVEAAELIDATLRATHAGNARVIELADAILGSGVLEEQLARALEDRTRQHIESNAATLATQIEERIAEQREALERLVRQSEDLQGEVDARVRQAERELAERIDVSWREHRGQLAEEHDRLQREREQLEKQARDAAERLASVADRYSQDREGVVADFLAILPLLHQAIPDITRRRETVEETGAAERTASVAAVPERRSFALPAYVTETTAAEAAQPSEAEFFERFGSHVTRSGFEYRTIDLQAFHLGVKCNDFTIVTGSPGTGKSSLPRLYAEALAGSEAAALDAGGGGRYLHIAVRPSWLDLQDLLGHVNVLEHSFEPAETGLFQALVAAVEERDRKGAETGMHIVCFDDMDLAPAEHCLSGLIQVLPRPERQRLVRCFDAHAVRSHDPFQRWHTLALPRSLRFVGTAAYDDAARPPGARLLDRAAVVRLNAGRPHELRAHTDSPAIDGAAVQWRTYARWVREAALPAAQAALLDRIEPAFTALGAPLTPRRYRDLCRFVASAGEVVPVDLAFDLQLAGRIHARTPGAWGRSAGDAVEEAMRALEAEGGRFPETLRALEALLADDLAGNGDG